MAMDLRQAFPFESPAVQHALRACWDYQRTLPLSDGGVPDRPATTTDLRRLYDMPGFPWVYWLPPDPVPQRPPPSSPPGRPFEELDAAFLHAVLCQVGLPRQRVLGREWTRRSGSAWLHVQAGVLAMGKAGPVEQPIPYGALPRLALAWISSYAVRHRTRDVPLGESANQFLRWIGLDHDGRRYAMLRRQLHALAACRLTLGQGSATYSGQPIEGIEVWLPGDGSQRALWPAHLALSRSYYDTLITRAVPLDPAALIALKGSALALDVYVWLAHRLHRVTEPTPVPWPRLKDQFGQEYQSLKDFKKEFRLRVRQVQAVYPAARVSWWVDQDGDLVSSGGLLLEPSPPPVRPTMVAVGTGLPQKAGGRGGLST